MVDGNFSKGFTWATNEVVTAAKLHAFVDDADMVNLGTSNLASGFHMAGFSSPATPALGDLRENADGSLDGYFSNAGLGPSFGKLYGVHRSINAGTITIAAGGVVDFVSVNGPNRVISHAENTESASAFYKMCGAAKTTAAPGAELDIIYKGPAIVWVTGTTTAGAFIHVAAAATLFSATQTSGNFGSQVLGRALGKLCHNVAGTMTALAILRF